MSDTAFLPFHLLQTSFLSVVSVTSVRFFGILEGNLIYIVTPFILWFGLVWLVTIRPLPIQVPGYATGLP